MTLRIPFIAERGPANQASQAKFEYFVAVATTSNEVPTGGREAFSLAIPFHNNQTRNGGTDEVEELIPLGPNDVGANYIVYVGLVLTEDELNYNRQTPSTPLALMAGRGKSRRRATEISGPRSLGDTPVASQAPAGAKRSRPSNVRLMTASAYC